MNTERDYSYTHQSALACTKQTVTNEMIHCKRLLAIAAFITLAIGIGGASAFQVGTCQAPTSSYPTIQDALNNSTCGTILVLAGNHQENLVIDRPGVTLRGDAPPNQVVIQARFADAPVILLTRLASDARLIGLTLRAGQRGVWALEARNVTLSNLVVEENINTGLYLESVQRGELKDSVIQKNGTGVELRDTTDFLLIENEIRQNHRCGVETDASSQVSGSHNRVFDNAGGNLCGGVVQRTDLLDPTPPAAPSEIQGDPGDWANKASGCTFEVNWTNPSGPAGIVAYWYKLGNPPEHGQDGTRRPIQAVPLSLHDGIDITREGQIPLYLWLENGLGARSIANAARVVLLCDKQAPTVQATNLTLSSPPNANGWYNDKVTATADVTCVDPLFDHIPANSNGSGVRSCEHVFPLNIDPGQKRCINSYDFPDATVTDWADNSASVSLFDTLNINIDRIVPMIKNVVIVSNGRNEVTPSLVFQAEIHIEPEPTNCSPFVTLRYNTDEFSAELPYTCTGNPCVFGDGVDDDGDGSTDEDSIDGEDNDGDGLVDEDPRAFPIFTCNYNKKRDHYVDPSRHIYDPGKTQYIDFKITDAAGNESAYNQGSIFITCESRFAPSGGSNLHDWANKSLDQAVMEVPSKATIILEEDLSGPLSLTIDRDLTIKGARNGERKAVTGQDTRVTLDSLTLLLTGDVQKFSLQNVNIQGELTLAYQGATPTVELDELQISGGQNGLTVTGGQGTLNVRNARIHGHSSHGLSAELNGMTLNLDHADVSDNDEDGIHLSGTGNVNLAHVEIYNNGHDGVDVGGTVVLSMNDATISGNGALCGDALCSGVLARDAAEVTLRASVISDNFGWGVTAFLPQCGFPEGQFEGSIEIGEDNHIQAGDRVRRICLR